MQISHEQIVFVGDQTKKEIGLTNNSQSVIIFKIKSNSIQSSKPSPSRGFIDLGQTKIVIIAQVKMDAKLLFNWAFVEHKSENFEDSWKKIASSQLSQKIVPVIRKIITHEKSLNNQEEDSLQIKSSSMSFEDNFLNSKSNSNANPIVSTKPKNEQILTSVTNPLTKKFSLNDLDKKELQNERQKHQSKQIKITETKIFKQEIRPVNQNRKINQNLSIQGVGRLQQTNQIFSSGVQFQNTQTSYRQGSQPNIFSQSSNVNELTQLCFVQSQLLVERQQCQRLKDELRKNKQMERERDEMMRQYNINRSMKEECQNDSMHCQAIFAIAIIFLTVGFLLSRF